MADTLQYGPTACQSTYDFVDQLAEGIDKNKDLLDNNVTLKIPLSPHVLLNFYQISSWSLIDSGSQITAISENFYNKVKSINNNLLELPVSNIMVATAIGKRNTAVKKQIYLDFQIDDYKSSHIFLVIPYLSNDIILGNDWHLKNGIVIDYNIKNIRIRNKTLSRQLVLFEEGCSDKMLLSKKDEITFIHLINKNDVVQNIPNSENHEVNKIKTNKNKNTNVIENEKKMNDIILEKNDKNKNQSIVENKKAMNDIMYHESNYVNEMNVLGNNMVNCEIENINENDISEELSSAACKLSMLSDVQRETFLLLLQKHKKLFISKNEPAYGYDYEIKINKIPKIQKTYPVPLALREKVREKIQNMLEASIIERATSPYCNPLRIVRKSNGDVRVCLDARQLNEAIEDDHECPPIVSEIMQHYYGAKFFSKLDLTNGYWQVPLHEKSRPLTAFLFEFAMYQFKRVPFGIKTAGSAFIRMLKNALTSGSKLLMKSLQQYIDDLLLGNATFEEHLQVLDELFSILNKFNFTLNISKCEFFKTEISFLGFVITSKGVIPGPENLETIKNFQEPRNQKQLRQLLGVCNYYRRFSLEYNKIVEQFRDLLKKDATWEWTDKHSQNFNNLKKSFIRTVCLTHIIQNATFYVQSDASDYGIGGVIFQRDDNNEKRIVSIVSRCLTNAEINYTTTEKELLAVVYTVTKFRYYLIGVRFEIITDHKGLTFLNSTLYHNSRLIRWSLLLQQYSFSVSYCRGVDNTVADFLSRNPEGKFFENDSSNNLLLASLHQFCLPDFNSSDKNSLCLVIMSMYANDQILKTIMKNLKHKQIQDNNISKIIQSLDNNNNNNNSQAQFYQVYQNILFQRGKDNENWCIVVPYSIKNELVIATHEKLGHPGVYKTLLYLSRYYYWRNMKQDVKRIVLSCDLCQRVKHISVAMEGEFQLVAASEPCELVTVDFYGPLPRGRGGVEYIFVVLDSFSKLVKLYAMKKATTYAALNRMFTDYIPKCGKPKRVLSDNGTQFSSSKWKDRFNHEGIKVVFSSVRHPQSNPTERVMREIGRLCRTLCSQNHTSWANHLKQIENLLNITTHFSTACTPYELHYGRPVKDKIEQIIKFPENYKVDHEYLITFARENIIKNFEMRKKQQKISNIELRVNDLVLLRVRHLSNALDKVTKKFFNLYEGPYRISKVVGKNAFVLVDKDDPLKEKVVYNRVNLKKYREPS